MNRKMIRHQMCVAVLACVGVAGCLLPQAARAQMDPSPNPQSPQNLNVPIGAPGNPSQTGSQTPVSTSMRDSIGAPGETGQQMQDRQFLRKAAEGGIAEVELGKLAAQKGGPEVKEFGQKMVDDHTAINKGMASVADSLGVMLPKKMNKDDQAELEKLKGLMGDDFDKEYILYMAKDHRADMREFRMEAMGAADATLAAEVTKASGVIREHLTMLTKLAKDKNIELPARAPRPPAPPAGQ